MVTVGNHIITPNADVVITRIHPRIPKTDTHAPLLRAQAKALRTLTNCVRTLGAGGYVKLTSVYTLGTGHAVGEVRTHIH